MQVGTKSQRSFAWPTAVAAVSLSLVSCGGAGTTATSTSPSTLPVAQQPTCRDVVKPQAAAQSQIAGGQSNLIVPSTSVERASDAGVRVHSNHLILARSVTRGTSGPSGLTPVELDQAYGIPANAGSGAIALIEVFDYPQALADFNVFSSTFGLPSESSSSATASSNQVLQVVYASGTQPRADGGWAQEAALDCQWAHAVAPGAKIYLVESASDTFSDILKAVAVAKALPNVREVSISLGGSEIGCSYVQYDSTFLQNGVAFFAAAGDTAGIRDYPALSSNVVAVGGTSLTTSANGTWVSETAWNGTGCGPSAYEPRPSFQDRVYSLVGLYRGGNDISAEADPNVGLSVYDSFVYQGDSGWMVFGGTSAATPVVAGIANDSGVTFSSSQNFNAILYSAIGSGSLHDITSGSSGGYSATAGWDFPTGVGTPNGLSTFLASASSALRSRR